MEGNIVKLEFEALPENQGFARSSSARQSRPYPTDIKTAWIHGYEKRYRTD